MIRSEIGLLLAASMVLLILPNLGFATQLTEQQVVNIATGVLRTNVSSNYLNDYLYKSPVVRGAPYTYCPDCVEVIFWRYVNGVSVENDFFPVTIDPDSGKVLSYGGWGPSAQASEVNTIPALTSDQAKWIIERAYSNRTVGSPSLIIVGKELRYRVEVGGVAQIDIDANTGATRNFNAVVGSTIPQVQTKFDSTSYYLDRFGLYFVAITILVIAGASLFVARTKLRHRAKKK